MKVIDYLFKWFRKWFSLKNTDYKYEHIDEIPDKLEENTIYVVSEEGIDWQILFKCPCGCKQDIALSLLKEYRPHWSYFIKRNRITISPSVDGLYGCKSHFLIIDGMIKWCENYNDNY